MQFQQIRSATSIVTFGGVRFLIDPMLSPANSMPAVPETVTCAPGNPTCELPCPIEALFDVDAVIVTHLHFDHFDEVAAKKLPRDLTVFSPEPGQVQVLQGYGFTDVRLLTEAGVDFKGVRLIKTACDHGVSDPVIMQAYADFGITEEASGVVMISQDEPGSFYLAGDTVLTQGVLDVIGRFAPKTVAVNCAGAQYPKGHPLIMNEYDVWALRRACPDVHIVCTHVEGVSHATVTRQSLRAFVAQKAMEGVSIPDDGQTIAL